MNVGSKTTQSVKSDALSVRLPDELAYEVNKITSSPTCQARLPQNKGRDLYLL